MNTWQAVLAYVVGPIIVGGGTWLTARYTSRTSKQAADTTAKVQEKADAVTGYHTLVADLRADIDRLRSDHNTLASKHENLKLHVQELERQRRKDRSLIRALYEYAVKMRAVLTAASLPVPEPPAGIDLDEPLPSS